MVYQTGRLQNQIDPAFEVQKQIAQLVGTQLIEGLEVQVYSCTWLEPYIHFIGVRRVGYWFTDQISHSPGIPRSALIPEKIEKVTAWVLRQIKKQRPEWLITSDQLEAATAAQR